MQAKVTQVLANIDERVTNLQKVVTLNNLKTFKTGEPE